MISQMVRNETVRFGRHIDIEVNYKILQLEIPKLVLIFPYTTCFRKNTLGPLGVNEDLKNENKGILDFIYLLWIFNSIS
jgi:hypothetical protein